MARSNPSIDKDEICVQLGTPGTTEYYCFASAGTSTSTSFWRIMRLTYDGSGNLTKKFANGSPAYAHIADNYASYFYA